MGVNKINKDNREQEKSKFDKGYSWKQFKGNIDETPSCSEQTEGLNL